jgi:hypothetical protein
VKRLVLLLVSAAALVALVPAPPVAADDASLRAAGQSRDPQFKRLGNKTRRTYRAWEQAGHPPRLARRLLRLNRRTRHEIGLVRGAIAAEEPSSEGGATYKRLMFRSLRAFDTAMMWNSRGVRRFMRGRRGAADAAWTRADRHLDRSFRLTRRAIRAIEG